MQVPGISRAVLHSQSMEVKSMLLVYSVCWQFYQSYSGSQQVWLHQDQDQDISLTPLQDDGCHQCRRGWDRNVWNIAPIFQLKLHITDTIYTLKLVQGLQLALSWPAVDLSFFWGTVLNNRPVNNRVCQTAKKKNIYIKRLNWLQENVFSTRHRRSLVLKIVSLTGVFNMFQSREEIEGFQGC